MVKRLLLIGALAIVFSVLGLSHSAYAHFVVEDTKTGVKASFHITPDHDPIAGKESIISFDFAKEGAQTEGYLYSLKVKPTKGNVVVVPVDVPGNVVLATYTFPSQGFYDIILTATHEEDGAISILQYGQRVSRGVVIERKDSFGLVEIVAVGGAVLLAVGVVIFSLVSDRKKRKGK